MSNWGIDYRYILKAVIVALLIVSVMTGLYYILILEPTGNCVSISGMYGDKPAEFCYTVVEISVSSAMFAALIAIWMVPTTPKKSKESEAS